jgi:hypothetical protein
VSVTNEDERRKDPTDLKPNASDPEAPKDEPNARSEAESEGSGLRFEKPFYYFPLSRAQIQLKQVFRCFLECIKTLKA